MVQHLLQGLPGTWYYCPLVQWTRYKVYLAPGIIVLWCNGPWTLAAGYNYIQDIWRYAAGLLCNSCTIINSSRTKLINKISGNVNAVQLLT